MLITRPFTNEEVAARLELGCTDQGMIAEACRRLRGLPGSCCPAVPRPADGDEIQRLRALAATCYAGLGAECNLPERWLDVLNAAANGEPFDTEDLLPFTFGPFPTIDPEMISSKEEA